ncbi:MULTISPECIES: MFS transporter [unclassified Knoellia]|uniref:MFS transporter n=1 Tax=Knoellia altitudinis TaxID=3404795 RepID=UPI0036109B08
MAGRQDGAWRTERLVLAALACSVAAQSMVRPTATYRALELGAGVLGVSLVVAASSALAVVGAVPIGRWIDRTGPKRCITVGGACLTVATVGGALSPNLAMVALSMALVGISHVAVLLAAQAMAAHASSPIHRQQRFARNAIAASLGQIVGPAIAGWVIAMAWPSDRFPTTGAFLAAAVIAAVATALALAMAPAAPADPGDGKARAKLSSRLMLDLAGRPGMPAALSSGVAVLIALDVLMAYLPLIGEAAGLPPAVVGGLLSFRGVCALASRLLMTPMIRRVGTRAVLAGTMFASALSLSAMVWATEVWQLALLIGIFGFGVGVGAPMTAAWVAQVSPVELRATALGLRLSGNRLGQALVPLGLGSVAASWGISIVLVTPALTLLACTWWVSRADLGESQG